MSVRSRPRAGLAAKEDIGDELNLWNSIVDKIKKCNALDRKYDEIAQKILAVEDGMRDNDPASSIAKLEELEKLHREGVKLAEEECGVLNEEPDDLIKNLETLAAVRIAFEADTPRSTVNKMSRNTFKRSRQESELAIDSPLATSEVTPPNPPTRVVGKVVSRSGSVTATSVKSENAVDLGDSTKAPDRKTYFAKGDQVFYRNKAKNSEGEGILCSVVRVIGDGKQRRYEIQDLAPEEDEHGVVQEQQPYRASVASLIAIPAPSMSLPDLPKGKQVLALYPQTTTFYRAEMMSIRKDVCNLRFEGEDETDREVEVPRRYVLEVTPK